MTDLGPIEEDVRFAWGPATALAAQLRTTAHMLDARVPRMRSAAHHATEDWHGAHRRKFDRHMEICTGDAAKFVTALQEAAEMLDQLAQLAHNEQNRREVARAWKIEHDEWERNHDGGIGGFLHDTLLGSGEPKPPEEPEIHPHPLVAASPPSGEREH
jgi:uncharacterized protein YukE